MLSSSYPWSLPSSLFNITFIPLISLESVSPVQGLLFLLRSLFLSRDTLGEYWEWKRIFTLSVWISYLIPLFLFFSLELSSHLYLQSFLSSFYIIYFSFWIFSVIFLFWSHLCPSFLVLTYHLFTIRSKHLFWFFFLLGLFCLLCLRKIHSLHISPKSFLSHSSLPIIPLSSSLWFPNSVPSLGLLSSISCHLCHMNPAMVCSPHLHHADHYKKSEAFCASISGSQCWVQ